MAECRISYDENGVASVTDELGRPSELYQKILDVTDNQEVAINTWSAAVLPESGLNGEATTLDQLLSFMDSTAAIYSELSPEELSMVKDAMARSGFENLSEFYQELVKLFKPNGYIQLPSRDTSGLNLYTQDDLRKLDIKEISRMMQKVEGHLMVAEEEYAAPFEQAELYIDTERTNIFGMSEKLTQAEISASILNEIQDFSDEAQIEFAVKSSPYTGFIEAFQTDPTFRESVINDFKDLRRIPTLTIVAGQLTDQNTTHYTTIKNTLLSGVDTKEVEANMEYLLSISPNIWNNNPELIRGLLKEIERDLTKVNIDVIGISNHLGSRDVVFDIMNEVLITLSQPNHSNIAALSAKLELLIPSDPNSVVELVNEEYDGYNVVKLESMETEANLFNNFGLIKIGEDLYHNVDQTAQVDVLIDYLSKKYVDGEFQLPKEFVTNTDMTNKTGVLEDINTYIAAQQEMPGLENKMLYTAYKEIFGHKPQQPNTYEVANLTTIRTNENYLKSDFVSDFYNYMLEEKAKDSPLYRSTLSHFQITDKDISLKGRPASIRGLKFEQELSDYIKLKRGSNMRYLIEDMSVDPAMEDLVAVNFPETIPELDGEYTVYGDNIALPSTPKNYIKIDGELYRKSGSNENTDMFSKITSQPNPVYFTTNMDFTMDKEQVIRDLDRHVDVETPVEPVGEAVPTEEVPVTLTEAVVDRLVETGLAKNVRVLSKEEIQEELSKMGVPENIAKQMAEGELMFYSNAQTALQNLTDKNKKNSQGWIKMLTDVNRNGGVKNVGQELEWIGLEDFLSDWVQENKPKGGNIPVEVIEKYIRDNEVGIEEIVKGGDTSYSMSDVAFAEFDEDSDNWYVEFVDDTYVSVGDPTLDSKEAMDEAIRQANEFNKTAERVATKYHGHILPGGQNYSEVLLTLREEGGGRELPSLQEWNNYMDFLKNKYGVETSYDIVQLAEEGKITQGERAKLETLERDKIVELSNRTEKYTSSHWDEENILAHLRLDERFDDQGNKVLMIQEIQSDWAQEGRKEGFISKKAEQEFVQWKKDQHRYHRRKRELAEFEEAKPALVSAAFQTIKDSDYVLGTNYFGNNETFLFEAKEFPRREDVIRDLSIIPGAVEQAFKVVDVWVKERKAFTDDIKNLEKKYGVEYNQWDGSSTLKRPRPGGFDFAEERKKLREAEREASIFYEDNRPEITQLQSKINLGLATEEEQARLDKILDKHLELVEAFGRIRTTIEAEEKKPDPSVPDMPYKKTDQWVSMAFRRVLKKAVQEGFDKIAWTTGEQQADLYNLSKQVDGIMASKLDTKGNKRSAYIRFKDQGDLTLFIDEDGIIYDHSSYGPSEDFNGQKLENVIGKEMANKIMSINEGTKKFEGEDLAVGGEGMRTFYNNIVPKVVKKEAKRFDKKAEIAPIEVPTEEHYLNELTGKVRGKHGFSPETVTVLALEITDAMKEVLLDKSIPLFQNAIEQAADPQYLVDQETLTLAIEKNNGNPMHMTKEGRPSKLYQDILDLPEVDGNQEAAALLKAKTYTDSFQAWFGDSKVVDENGEPLLVYHGGFENIEQFDEAYGGDTTNNNDYGAFFFSENYDVAEDYARQSFVRRFEGRTEEELVDYEDFTPEEVKEMVDEDGVATEASIEEWFDSLENQEQYIVKGFLNMENPMVDASQRMEMIDTEKTMRQVNFAKNQVDEMYEFTDDYTSIPQEVEEEYKGAIEERMEEDGLDYEEAREEVFAENDVYPEYEELDGVIIEDVIDSISQKSNIPQTEYIALDANQIKSIFNNGNFSTTDDRIASQSALDRTEVSNIKIIPQGFVNKNTGIVTLNDEAIDPVNTAIHEFGHLFNEWIKSNRRDIYDRGLELAKTDEAAEYRRYVKQTQPSLEEGTEAFNEEVITQVIGDNGARIVKGARKNSIREWLNNLWEQIKAAIGITDLTAEEVSKLTLQEYADRVATDLLKGENLKEKMKKPMFGQAKNIEDYSTILDSNVKLVDLYSESEQQEIADRIDECKG